MVKVIVAITTFNLEQYIEEALDSVLAQETNFEYKIVVADDCSKDNTLKILQNYSMKHPEKIVVLDSDKNVGALANSNRIFENLQCEYFTFLDGDDYWVGKDRLQRQVDFLEQNPTYMMCAGNTQYLKNGVLADYVVDKRKLGKTYTFDDMLNERMPFFHTSSILVRNTIFINGLLKCYKEAENTFENCALRGEDFRRIIHLEQGPLYAMEDTLSVYRIHENGIWQGSTNFKRMLEATIGFNFYAKFFGNKYGDYFIVKRNELYKEVMKIMVLDKDILSSYVLTEKESELFLALLKDIRTTSLGSSKSHLKNILVKMFFSIYKRL